MQIIIRSTDAQKDSHGHVMPFSSAPSYDRSLGSIFPYFAILTGEEATELGALLSRGYNEELRIFTPTSFALVTTFNFDHSRILWLSQSSVTLLKQHKDLYTLTYLDEATDDAR